VNRISIIGLGKLGSPMAAVFADGGFEVVGVDLCEAFVDALNAGEAPVSEPELADLIAANRSRLRATTDTRSAVAATDATFIIVPTPSDENGVFTTKYVLEAVDAIGAGIRDKEGDHLVVVTSTVMPLATEQEIRPRLEEAAGRRCGEGLGLCYSPEFIALGSVIRDMRQPDFILIGESDPAAGQALLDIYRRVVKNPELPVSRTNFVNAELSKIAVNTYVTTKISYANMLAQVCEGLIGADVDAVTSAIGLDSRIGRKYLKGALGYGGPCFPRDNVAFSALARLQGGRAIVAEATDEQNRSQLEHLAKLVEANRGDGAVAILGLSYKPGTPVIECSAGVDLAEALAARGVEVVVHDPEAMPNARRRLGEQVRYAESARAALGAAEVVVLTVAWDEYRALQPEALRNGSRRKVIIDCWRLLDRERFAQVAEVLRIGEGPRSREEARASV